MSISDILNQIIEELTTEGLTQGYDTSVLREMDKEILFFFHRLGKFRCWDALFEEIDPKLLIEEDLLKAIFKTDYVSQTKIRLIKECIANRLSIEPLLCADYDEASAHIIYCGLSSNIDPEELMDNGRKLSKAELYKIIKGRVDADKLIT